MKKIVYIAGYGHSGSTLYGIILGGCSHALYVGEIHRLAFPEEAHRLDKPLQDPRLEQVRIRLKAFIAGAMDLQKRLPLLESLFARRARQVSVNLERYQHFWDDALAIIAQESGAEFIIDSSKTAWGQIERPRLLRDGGHDVFLLHLVKDPRSLAYSRLKRGSPALAVKSVLGWAMTNFLTVRRYKAWRSRYMISSYEDFVRSPRAELEAIGAFIGVDLSENAKRIELGLGFEPGFQFGGNRAGRKKEVVWRPDATWKNEAPYWVKVIGAPVLPLFHFLLMEKKRQRQA